jgi:hypothetical protein
MMKLRHSNQSHPLRQIKVLGQPEKGQPANPGYIVVFDSQDKSRVVDVANIKHICIEENLGEELVEQFGARARGLNLTFKAEDETFNFSTDTNIFMSLLHKAKHGYSFDLTSILNNNHLSRALPLPIKLGDYRAGKGIYMGLWEPEQSLGRIFNVYAATEDLFNSKKDSYNFTFDQAQKELASLRDWQCQNGSNIDISEDISEYSNEELSQWMLPRQLLHKHYSETLLSPYLRTYLIENPEQGARRYIQSTGRHRNELLGNFSDVTFYLSTEDQKNYHSPSVNTGRVRPIRLEPYKFRR